MTRNSRIVTTPERSRLMARVRQSGTSAELAVRSILDRLGVRYQVKADDLPGSPDIVSRNDKWVVFVNGCFWHSHEGCKRWKIPRSNRAFWKKKFLDNRRRDKEKIDRLREKGYAILVVWECELEKEKSLENKIREFLSFHRSRPDNELKGVTAD